MNELNAAIIGAGVGGLFAYGGGWLQELLNRRRRRRALATALLIELRWLQQCMEELRDVATPSTKFSALPLLFHDALLEDTLVFRAETVQAILTCLGYTNDIRIRIERLNTGIAKPGPTWDHELRRLAALTAAAVPAAMSQLTKEGGARLSDSAAQGAWPTGDRSESRCP